MIVTSSKWRMFGVTDRMTFIDWSKKVYSEPNKIDEPFEWSILLIFFTYNRWKPLHFNMYTNNLYIFVIFSVLYRKAKQAKTQLANQNVILLVPTRVINLVLIKSLTAVGTVSWKFNYLCLQIVIKISNTISYMLEPALRVWWKSDALQSRLL